MLINKLLILHFCSNILHNINKIYLSKCKKLKKELQHIKNLIEKLRYMIFKYKYLYN